MLKLVNTAAQFFLNYLVIEHFRYFIFIAGKYGHNKAEKIAAKQQGKREETNKKVGPAIPRHICTCCTLDID